MMDIEVIPTEFSVNGEKIRGNFVKPLGEGLFPGICKFHGLPGDSDQVSGIATEFAKAGFMVLTFDFRGFRESEGLFSLSGEIEDAKAAITHLLASNQTIESWTGVVASSYGAATAVCAASSDERIKAVGIQAPIYDTLSFAKSPMIQPAVDQIVATDPTQIRGLDDPETRKIVLQRMIDDAEIHNPLNEISRISPRPLLVIHGSADHSVDMEGVKRLFELAGEPKQLEIIEGGDHNLSDPAAYEETMKTAVGWFLEQWKNQ